MPCPNKQNLSLSACDTLGCDTLSQCRIPWPWKQEVPHYCRARTQGVTTRKLTTVQTSNLITHISKYLQAGYFVNLYRCTVELGINVLCLPTDTLIY